MTKICVAQYEVERLPGWQAYEDKIIRMVEEARNNDAELLCMSEYAGLELAGWSAKESIPHQFEHLQTLLDAYQQLFLSLAEKYQLYLQPGTVPVKERDGYYRNRAYLFSPNGKIAYQDKIYLAPFELQIKCLRPGTELTLFETEWGKIGIAICYDCEFPPLTHELTRLGANLILVPSCTEKMSGLTRVAICSKARAIENQCYVALSSLIGKASWCDFIDVNSGRSAIYCPADIGFPEEGTLAQASLNTPMLIHAELSWNKLEHVRLQGEMHNFEDSQKESHLVCQSTNMMEMA